MDDFAANLVLSCRVEFIPDALNLTYRVVNHDKADVYLLDAFPGTDPLTGRPAPDYNKVYICWQGTGKVLALKGIPPLPLDRDVKVRVIPWGTRLPPDQEIERSFRIALPVREESPYDAPLPPQGYERVEVQSLVFALHVLSATADGFVAEPLPEEKNLFSVRSKNTVGHAKKLTTDTPAPKLQLLKRTDHFSRL